MSHSGGGIFKMPIVGGRIAKLPSYNEILPRLYLGDICMATNREEMARLGITDMISVEIKTLNPADLAPTIKRYLYINVMDHSKQDILSHFDTSNEFIETALKTPSNKVYVHCVAGISRSATLIIAYIMKTRSMTYMEAYTLVKEKRKIIDPNEGFVKQLSLYYRMKYTIDIGHLEYRRIVLDALVFEFRLLSLSYYQTNQTKTSIFPLSLPGLGSSSSSSSSSSSGGGGGGGGGGSSSNNNQHHHHHNNPSSSTALQGGNMPHMPPIQGHGHITINQNNIGILFGQYYNKLNLQQVSKYPHVYQPSSAFRCKKCRVIVFYAISVIENKLDDSNLFNPKGTTSTTVTTLSSRSSTASKSTHSSTDHHHKADKECQFIFIEPQPWMSRSIYERDGNLECYKCKKKLGKFDWTSGESCSCPRHNSHMNFNLFKIMRKKIDTGGPGLP